MVNMPAVTPLSPSMQTRAFSFHFINHFDQKNDHKRPTMFAIQKCVEIVSAKTAPNIDGNMRVSANKTKRASQGGNVIATMRARKTFYEHWTVINNEMQVIESASAAQWRPRNRPLLRWWLHRRTQPCWPSLRASLTCGRHSIRTVRWDESHRSDRLTKIDRLRWLLFNCVDHCM